MGRWRPCRMVYLVGLSARWPPGGGVFLRALPGKLKVASRALGAQPSGQCPGGSVAAWNENGEFAFAAGASTSTAKVSSHGEIKVHSAALDDLVRSGQVKPPALIKMDIEGAEAEALEGMDATLRTHRPTILLATHGLDIRARVCRFLSIIGYHVEGLDGLNAESTGELIAIAPPDMREAQPSDGMGPHEATGPIPQDGRG